MVNVNSFAGKTDAEIINDAIKNRDNDGIVVISPRNLQAEPRREYWLLDEAVLLPENTTIILQNVTIKLSDKCRDNFFRSANCGIGIESPMLIKNIHIKGEGSCVLVGADHPRATGDASKHLHVPCPHFPEDVCKFADWIPKERRTTEALCFWDIHNHSYGTDAGKEGESQCGDWRGVGILLANVQNFSISNVKLSKTHGWGISLEACSDGHVEKICFDSCMHKMIDGIESNMENQDGLDIRNGCHHIMISDITGETGDDVIALTAIANPKKEYKPGGSMRTTHVMHNDWSKREKDIHDIIIKNVMACSHLCWVLRLLPANCNIYNIIADGIIETSENCNCNAGTILLGDGGDSYAENLPDSLRNISISNVICNSRTAIALYSFMTDSVITNIINRNPNCKAFSVSHEDGIKNTVVANLVTTK